MAEITCPTCGPTTTEDHPRRPGVQRCVNCKEWLKGEPEATQAVEPSFEVADFHPGTSHKHDCPKTRVSSGADCTENCIHDLFAVAQDAERVVNRLRHEQDNVDRNARAYGWEVGHTGSMPPSMLDLSKDNPFLYPDWRERAGLA